MHVSPMFPSFPYRKHCFQRCKLCLRYTAGNVNENPSMRALAKILRAIRAKAKFCEHFQNGWDRRGRVFIRSKPLGFCYDRLFIQHQKDWKEVDGIETDMSTNYVGVSSGEISRPIKHSLVWLLYLLFPLLVSSAQYSQRFLLLLLTDYRNCCNN